MLDQLNDLVTIAPLDDLFGGDARLLKGKQANRSDPVLALDAPHLYARKGNPYLDPEGRDWHDNALRYAALSYVGGKLAAGLDEDWSPTIIHAHDWQAGLTAYYAKFLNESSVGTIFTIHNLAFQGVFPSELIADLQLNPNQFATDGFEYHGQIGMLKAGIYFSDQITTVSPSYSIETQTSDFGMGLEGLLTTRKADYTGIVNGIDIDIWNPQTDVSLACNYNARNIERRAANKIALQKRFGLSQTSEGPLYCVVSRLTTQKGMDLVLAAIPKIVELGGQFALLGSGDEVFENAFKECAERFPHQVSCKFGYDEPLSHLLQAGSDLILIPSRFEPCGLTQLYAMRYGCVPVVTRVGGLRDTIIDANHAATNLGVATGFLLDTVSAEDLLSIVERVSNLFKSKDNWQKLQIQGMSQDLSWTRSAYTYKRVYQKALTNA